MELSSSVGRQGGQSVNVKDEDKEIARCFFTHEDLQEMGSSADLILEKVAKDPTIRRNLKKHMNENLFD